jgi:hypothetical protein
MAGYVDQSHFGYYGDIKDLYRIELRFVCFVFLSLITRYKD